jgi:hypothetical protein
LSAALAYADPAARASFQERFEIRAGGFMHGAGSFEQGTHAINIEMIAPVFQLDDAAPRLRPFVPRMHVGGMFNVNGKTNYLYAGALWTFDLPANFFIEGFLGGSAHDGSLEDNANIGGMPTRAALGCRLLFHTGASAGYRIAKRWNVTFTVDHISNGGDVFNLCTRNQGLTQLGVRVGYAF